MNKPLLPTHGAIDCTICYPGQNARWDETAVQFGPGTPPKWQIENNPAAWGSREPRFLVLGFSKGPNQRMRAKSFDDVPFAGMRPTLTSILASLGLLRPGESIDDKISADETDWAFGSLVRCSVSQFDASASKYVKSGGNIIVKAATDPCARPVVRACVQRYQSALPDSVRIVIMLGNDERYVNACLELLSEHHSLRRVNEVAYTDGRTLWVHTVHPKAQGSHHADWLRRDQATSQGRKGQLAEIAIADIAASLAVAYGDRPSFTPELPAAGKAIRAASSSIKREQPDLSESFSDAFYFLTQDGSRLYPVRVKNKFTGLSAFRVSRDGNNTKAGGSEISDEREMCRLVLEMGWSVRVAERKPGSQRNLRSPHSQSIKHVVVSRRVNEA